MIFGKFMKSIDKIFNYNYPIFNIADCAVVIGVILLIIAIFKGEDKVENNSSK